MPRAMRTTAPRSPSSSEGYTHAGIQMSVTSGSASQKSDPNPVGCRLVVFNDKHWVAYLAKRDDERFLFRTGRPQYVADQSGGWPATSTPGPDNAKVSLNGDVAVAVDKRGMPSARPVGRQCSTTSWTTAT